MGEVRHLAGAETVGACATAVVPRGGSPPEVYSLAGGARILALRLMAVGRASFDALCINLAAMAVQGRNIEPDGRNRPFVSGSLGLG